MSPIFWADAAAYGVSTVIAIALVLVVGAGPRRLLNLFFALFSLCEAGWAFSSLLLRMTLWLEAGNPPAALESATLAFALMGPCLFLFTTRFVSRRALWTDVTAALGIVVTVALSIPLFRHRIVLQPRLGSNGTITYDLSVLGFVVAIVPALYLTASLVLFWRERRRTGGTYLVVSVLVLLAGFVGGGLFNPPFPVMSITTTFSVVVLGYAIVSRQILNPLRELTLELERKVQERTEELERAFAEVEIRVEERTRELSQEVAERKRVETALRQRTAQLEALRQVGLELTAHLDLGTLLHSIVSRAIDLVGGTSGGLYLYRPERDALEWVTSVGPAAQPPGSILHCGEGLCGRVWEMGTPLIVDDYQHWEGRAALFEGYPWGAIAAVPVSWADEFLGVLSVEADTPRSFSQHDADLLALFATRAAIAIRNVRLYEEAQSRSRYLETLQRINATLRSTLPLRRVLETIVASTGEVLDYVGSLIIIPSSTGERLTLGAAWGSRFVRAATRFTGSALEAFSLPLSATESPMARAYLTGELQVFREPERIVVGVEPPIKSNLAPAIARAMGARLAACIPLPGGDGETGVLVVLSPRDHLSDEERAMLLGLADQAGLAIESAHLYEAARSRAERLAVVNNIARAVGTALHLDDLLETVYREVASIFHADAFFVALYDEDANELEFRIQVDEGTRLSPERQSADTGLSSLVVARQEPLLIRNLEQEREHLPAPFLWGTMKMPLSWLGVPMQIGRRLVGVICVQTYGAHAYGEEDQLLLATIAEQLAVAVEKARLYQTLLDSEERYRTLFEQANDAVFVTTVDGKIVDVNDKACQLLGYEHQELLGLTIDDIVSPGTRERWPRRFPEAARLNTPLEITYLRKDRSPVVAEASTGLLEVGEEQLVLTMARDISMRRSLEEQLRQAQKMEALGTLAGGIAHDFNNLLTGILGYASVARQELQPDSLLRSDLETIILSAQRAADLTRQLQTFAHQGQQVEMQALGLTDVVVEVVKLLERTIDKAISIETHLAKDLHSVRGDASQLHQMLLNLCLNARDAMPQGGRLIIEAQNERVSAEETASQLGLGIGQHVVLTVTDTGAGMKASVRERIFEPFFTTKEPGRGLGLAMVYGVVRGHGGGIHVHSEPGEGTTFRVYLPAVTEAIAPPQPAEGTVPGGRETVLVVDDEEHIRRLLQRILERGGYRVLLADDGARGVELYQETGSEIDLVVLDVIMPHMGGREAYARLREIDPQVKVLLSSGYSEDGQAAAMLAAGALGFLQKPYDLDTVLRTVRRTLDIEG